MITVLFLALIIVGQITSAKVKDVDLKAVALGHRDRNVIVVNDSVKTSADIKGKTFAIPSTKSSYYILMQEELKRAEPFGAQAVKQRFGKVLIRSDNLW